MVIARPVRLAVALWIVLALVVWNVVFDRLLVLAGRRYVYGAAVAAQGSGPYVRINDWMGPARTHALWMATGAGVLVLLIGMSAIALAVRRRQPAGAA